jgi:hypothetical protein
MDTQMASRLTIQPSRPIFWAALAIAACLALWACQRSSPTTSPESTLTTPSAVSAVDHATHLSAAVASSDDKGLIDGWYEGAMVHLYYTRSYFCAEPPSSGAPSDCEIGAPPEVPPRGGPIPKIYAIAPVGFQPDPATVACPAGSTCLDHPAMIDASRIAGPGASSRPGLPHSHIIDGDGPHAGWFNTVNVRVFSLSAWNEIASAKTLAKVRELQGNPAIGTPGVISADTPTNVYFFIASWRK